MPVPMSFLFNPVSVYETYLPLTLPYFTPL